MAIERNFDVAFTATQALREKQVQQNYRPIIAVHKWFARRPGTLFRSLILSEFGQQPLHRAFYQPHAFQGRVVLDPFMGGGTPLLEANRVGCDVIGYDINPMAVWIVREEIEPIDLAAYTSAARSIAEQLVNEVGRFYSTRCLACGEEVPTKYFLWVKVQPCENCGEDLDLFPGYLLAEDVRHPRNVLVCSACGCLSEVADLDRKSKCKKCSTKLFVEGPAKRGSCACPRCGHINQYPNTRLGVPRHRLFALEYYCPHCKPTHRGRFFKQPDRHDMQKFAETGSRWKKLTPRFVPNDAIMSGDETDRLHRWGYGQYRDLFNARQLLGLELCCRAIDRVRDTRVRQALSTNLSDLLRYQNMLCRYDTMALKSLDIFSIHGYPVGLVQCESNLLGIPTGNGANIGSGGWSNIVEKYIRAKNYCNEPFEMEYSGSRRVQVPIHGEWIGDQRNGVHRGVALQCRDSANVDLPPASVDAVFTDPPYFGNVQYAELMDFCYVWLRKLAGQSAEGFTRNSTRAAEELTGNVTMERGLEHFTAGLSAVFERLAMVLKPGAPLAFTFHHNRLNAYHAIGVAILDAGLICSASLPCPAEMSGSIHIHGTESSIVDMVFVCRERGKIPRRWLFSNARQLVSIVADDLRQLRDGGLKPSLGDVRCITFGHITRMAVWKLRRNWGKQTPLSAKLEAFKRVVEGLPDVDEIVQAMDAVPPGDLFHARATNAELFRDAVSF